MGEHNQKELIGAFFSERPVASQREAICPLAHGGGEAAAVTTPGLAPSDVEGLLKITQYVERAPAGCIGFRFYAVLETVTGRFLVTERPRGEEAPIWIEGAKELEARNSAAKVIRAADCHEGAPRVGDLKTWSSSGAGRALATSEHYAQGLFDVVVGEAARGE